MGRYLKEVSRQGLQLSEGRGLRQGVVSAKPLRGTRCIGGTAQGPHGQSRVGKGRTVEDGPRGTEPD